MTRNGNLRMSLVMVVVLCVAAGPAGGEDCPVFLLKSLEGELLLDRASIPSGQMQVWPATAESGLVDVILPVGGGVSGSVANAGDGRLHIVRCTGTELRHEVRMPDGTKYENPTRTLEDLRRYNVRVSATGAAGQRRAFLISRWNRVEYDAGPVQNLLAGQPIPLGDSDYMLTTDTYLDASGSRTTGEFRVELAGYPFAKGRGPDGTEGWFLIDTGGAQSLVAKSFLASDAAIEESNMVQYSSGVRRVLDYEAGGATGQVPGILGHTEMESLRFGEVEFTDVRAAVMEEIPDLFDRPIVGILGIDQLRRSGRLVLEFPPGGSGEGVFRLASASDTSDPGESVTVVPFSMLRSHLVVPLAVNRVPTHFILDTGAPISLLDLEAARQAGVEAIGAPGEAGGLDGGKVERSRGIVDVLTVGGSDFKEVDCMIAALPIFQSLQAKDQRVGLLGNTFLGRFSRVEIDFVGNRVLFVQ